MSAPIRWCLLAGLVLVSCSSSSANDGKGTGGHSGGSGDSGASGGAAGTAGSTSGGASGANACAGTASECITCCTTKLPDGYTEFLDEFKLSQCGAEACAGTCQDVCMGSTPTWTQTCAECLWAPNPKVHTSVKLSCQASAKDDCQQFAGCLETCQLE